MQYRLIIDKKNWRSHDEHLPHEDRGQAGQERIMGNKL